MREIHDSRRAGDVIGELGEVYAIRLFPKPARLHDVGVAAKGFSYAECISY